MPEPELFLQFWFNKNPSGPFGAIFSFWATLVSCSFEAFRFILVMCLSHRISHSYILELSKSSTFTDKSVTSILYEYGDTVFGLLVILGSEYNV